MEEITERDHLRDFISRLAKAAENDLLESRQIPESVRRRDHLFRSGIAVTKPQIIPVIAGAFVSHAEIAAVGAFVGKIDVQIPVQGIQVRILAVFLLFVRLILAPSVFIILVLGRVLFLLLALVLALVLTLTALFILVFVLLSAVLILILRVLRRILGVLLFFFRRIRLSILRALRVLIILSAVAALMTATASSAAVPVAIAAFRALRLYLFVFVFDFVHRILFQLEKQLFCVPQNLCFQFLLVFIPKPCHVLHDGLHVFRFVGKHSSKGHGR